MSLLDKVSLLITPNAVKASKLYSVIPSNGAGDLTVVRNTTATRVNTNGIDESVALNVARLNYDSVGGAPHILMEGQRTNLLLNSATLATQSITTTAAAHTLSFRGTGTVTLSGSFTGSLVGTGANNRVAFTFTPTAATLTVTINGSCTNGQIELGGFATSYIPTLASAVTRNADLISKSGISDLINSEEGVLFLEMAAFSNDTSSRSIVISNGSNSYIYIRFDSFANRVLCQFFINGVSASSNLTHTLSDSSNFNKLAIVYSSSKFNLFANGQSVSTSTPTLVNSANTYNKITFGTDGQANTGNFAGKIKSCQIYKGALTDAELTNLTTI